jgi:hypothetical protein
MEVDDPVAVFALMAEAVWLRNAIYWLAEPNSDIETWALELGGVLANLRRKLEPVNA